MTVAESPLDVAAQIDALTASIEAIQDENSLIGAEAELLAAFLHGKGAGAKGEKMEGIASDSDAPGRKLLRYGGSTSPRKTLTLQEKYDIAQGEMRMVSMQTSQSSERIAYNMEILRALLEVAEVQAAEVKRDALEFRRDVVMGAENIRTGKTIAERVLRHFEDKLTQKDTVLSKILSKNKSMQISIRKIEAELKERQQSGEVMNFIDFQQLQIDNELSVKKIDEINKELLSLKKSYAKIVEQVNSTKKRIGDLLNEENMLKQEMEGRKKVLTKTEKDIRKVAVEREKARKENSKLRGMTRNVRTDGGGSGGPRFMECLKLKMEEQNLEKSRKNLERKLEIMEGQCRKMRKGIW